MSKTITNEWGLAPPVFDAIDRIAGSGSDYDAGPSDITASQLSTPPQIRVLQQRHEGEIVEDVADMLWAAHGTVKHKILEAIGERRPQAVVEERLFADGTDIPTHGWKLSGQIDYYEDGTLADYKYTSVFACQNGPRQEWINQANVNARLARAHGYHVDRIKLVCWYRDWGPRHRPTPPVQEFGVDYWGDEAVDNWISERIQWHQSAETRADADLPECSLEERWETDDAFAHMRTGRKSAVKLYKAGDYDAPQAEAEKAVEGDSRGYVEYRPGEPKRCMPGDTGRSYCPVAAFCGQWANDPRNPANQERG